MESKDGEVSSGHLEQINDDHKGLKESVPQNPKKRPHEEEQEDTPCLPKKRLLSHSLDDHTEHFLQQLSPYTYINVLKYDASHFEEGEQGYFECPQPFETKRNRASVFLAGGISGCVNWQQIMKKQIEETMPGLVCLNPRRSQFDVSKVEMHYEQIKWEFDHLRLSSVILFWFPCETLCPITLYELGSWSILHKLKKIDIIVGCDPKYARIADVRTQLSLATGSNFPIVQSLDELALSLKQWYESHQSSHDIEKES